LAQLEERSYTIIPFTGLVIALVFVTLGITNALLVLSSSNSELFPMVVGLLPIFTWAIAPLENNTTAMRRNK
jgi:hypothetical protein